MPRWIARFGLFLLCVGDSPFVVGAVIGTGSAGEEGFACCLIVSA